MQELICAARSLIETLVQSLALSYTICGAALEFASRPSLLYIIRQAPDRCVAAAIISIHIKASACNLPFLVPARHILSSRLQVSIDDLPELEARLLTAAYPLLLARRDFLWRKLQDP